MPESFPQEPSRESLKDFEVVEQKVSDGSIYDIYFTSVEAMDGAIREFWEQSRPYIANNIQRGMLRPLDHEIVASDRSVPFKKLRDYELKEHPGMICKVHLNGNNSGLSEKGVETLRRMGYI